MVREAPSDESQDPEHPQHQQQPAAVAGSVGPTPNFKGFRKRAPLTPRLPTIGFAADTWAQGNGGQNTEFLKCPPPPAPTY